jgi:hypothetical protein
MWQVISNPENQICLANLKPCFTASVCTDLEHMIGYAGTLPSITRQPLVQGIV